MQEKEHRYETGNKASWEVILFFSLYVISPSYFALELSEKLPLLTFSRFLLVLMGGMLLLRRRRELFSVGGLKRQNWNLALTNEKVLRIGLFGYFLLLLISNIALLPRDFAEAVKAIFVLAAEEFLLVWILTLILDTREKLLSALKALVYASGIVGIVVAVGCVLECNPFFLLNTVQRDMMLNTEFRLGMVRACAGFGHPVYYGAFCAVILPINMYFIEQGEKRWEKVLLTWSMSMSIVGLVLANARGAIFAMGCLIIFSVIQSIVRREFKNFCRMYIPVAVIVVAVLVVVSMMAPVGIKFLWGYVYSLLRIVFPGLSLDVLADAGIEYGLNASGGFSRIAQLSGITYTLKNKPLFGFGAHANAKGLIPYEFRPGQWWVVPTVDVGIVAVICQFGIVGFCGYTLLYGSILHSAFKFRKDRLMQALGVSFTTFMICLVTISSLGKMDWVLIAAIVCLTNIILKERKDAP